LIEAKKEAAKMQIRKGLDRMSHRAHRECLEFRSLSLCAL
jgi:hypothetical protein